MSSAYRPAALRFYTAADTIPAVPGAYLLAIALAEPMTIARPVHAILGAGDYFYAGSAYGPGGLRARISRHMRRAKTCRWHIDQITAVAEIRGAWVLPNGDECELVAWHPALPMPILGFGSSDCRRCRSHLLGPLSSRPRERTRKRTCRPSPAFYSRCRKYSLVGGGPHISFGGAPQTLGTWG